MTPREIINMMRAGNDRFRRGTPLNRDFLHEQAASVGAQYSAAILLTCIDSRAPAEIIMDLGIGQVLNARLAGNVVVPEVLGSVEFACSIAGAKVILVMGHTGCSAVTSAVAGVTMGHFSSLLGRISPAIQATPFDGHRSADNPDFVNAVSRTNVAITMESIRRESPLLRALIDRGRVELAGAMYDLASAKIDFFDPS